MQTTCKTCKFHAHDGGPYGICHRMPPTAGGWPRTAPHDWCGEHVEAPAKPVEAPVVEAIPAVPNGTTVEAMVEARRGAPARGRPSKVK